MPVKGGELQEVYLGEGEYPRYSPDGKTIAYLQYAHPGLQIGLMDMNGTPASRRVLQTDVYRGERSGPGWWSWLSDGRLAYQMNYPPGGDYKRALAIFNPANPTERKIWYSHTRQYESVSPDGSYILSREGERFIIESTFDRAPLPATDLLPLVRETAKEAGDISDYIWSPDGRRLLVDCYDDKERSYLKLVTLNGAALTVSTLLTYPKSPPEAARYSVDFIWSPDGQKVAFREVTQDNSQGNPILLAMQQVVIDLKSGQRFSYELPISGAALHVAGSPRLSYGRAHFSPDGTIIATGGIPSYASTMGYRPPPADDYVWLYYLNQNPPTRPGLKPTATPYPGGYTPSPTPGTQLPDPTDTPYPTRQPNATPTRYAATCDVPPPPFTDRANESFDGLALSTQTLTFSPDGQTLAIASRDGLVKLWNVATKQKQFSLTAACLTVSQLSYSPDGRKLAASGQDFIRIWDVASRREIQTLHAYNLDLSVGWNADGTLLITGDKHYGILTVWNVASGQQVRSIKLVEHNINPNILALAVSPDGKTVATAGWGSITFWDIATDQPLTAQNITFPAQTPLAGMETHKAGQVGPPNPTALVYSGDGSTLFALLETSFQIEKPSIVQIKIATGQIINRVFIPTTSEANQLLVSRDNHWLAVVDRYGGTILFNLADNWSRADLQASGNLAAARIAFSPDSGTLAIVRYNKTLELKSLSR